ncbi:glycosyltransferase family 4 protein [Variovorax sp. YR216]|uniref:glycosyltransferase family 4 protein n=1 Tax=Variovorax sp. YR216 TaxID=1882828 RepID=UPI0008965268|nr:glycosyltransferase family 4 protein [Variovorax sp. YR216]SEB00386.1 Glycosyltransferase involved in cell wall bisynthesis [Variovorax sp. YR216]
MRISYINSVCVRHDAISNAIRDELGFLNDAGCRDVHLYAQACDYSELPHTRVDRVSDIALSPHFQASDIVVFHFGVYYPLFDLLPASPKNSKRIVVFHNITPKEFVPSRDHWLIEKSFVQLDNIRWADRVVCDSTSNLRVLEDRGITTDAVVVPLALHSALAAPETKPSFGDDQIRIAFVGRFTRAKGPHDLLVAIERVLSQEQSDSALPRRVRLDLVGNLQFSDPSLLVQLDHDISRLRASIPQLEIHLQGNASDHVKHSILGSADIFVLPTYHEGFCVPIIEAIASGCSVIAYGNSNVPAICGGLARLVQTADIDALAGAVASGMAQVRAHDWRQGEASGYRRYLHNARTHVAQFAPVVVARRFLDALSLA